MTDVLPWLCMSAKQKAPLTIVHFNVVQAKTAARQDISFGAGLTFVLPVCGWSLYLLQWPV